MINDSRRLNELDRRSKPGVLWVVRDNPVQGIRLQQDIRAHEWANQSGCYVGKTAREALDAMIDAKKKK